MLETTRRHHAKTSGTNACGLRSVPPLAALRLSPIAEGLAVFERGAAVGYVDELTGVIRDDSR